MSIVRSAAVPGSDKSRKTYISTQPFHKDIFQYNNERLRTVRGATEENCPKGRYLRETGRRLYPGTNEGVETLMVGVFDDKTSIHGFIDPLSFAFTPQTTDRSYSETGNGYNPNRSLSPNRKKDLGPPVYTQGDVSAKGNLIIGNVEEERRHGRRNDEQGNAILSGNLIVGNRRGSKGGDAEIRGNIRAGSDLESEEEGKGNATLAGNLRVGKRRGSRGGNAKIRGNICVGSDLESCDEGKGNALLAGNLKIGKRRGSRGGNAEVRGNICVGSDLESCDEGKGNTAMAGNLRVGKRRGSHGGNANIRGNICVGSDLESCDEGKGNTAMAGNLRVGKRRGSRGGNADIRGNIHVGSDLESEDEGKGNAALAGNLKVGKRRSSHGGNVDIRGNIHVGSDSDTDDEGKGNGVFGGNLKVGKRRGSHGGNAEIRGNLTVGRDQEEGKEECDCGNVEIRGDVNIRGQFVGPESIGDENIDWRVYKDVSGVSVFTPDGISLSGNAGLDNNNGIRLNNGRNESGSIYWSKTYNAETDIVINATLKSNYLGDGGNSWGTGVCANVFIGSNSYSQGATNGIQISVNDGNNSITVSYLSVVTTFDISDSIEDDVSENRFRNYTFVIRTIDDVTSVLIQVNGVYIGSAEIGDVEDFLGNYVGVYGYSDSGTNTAHWVKSFSVKPANAWILTN